MIPTDGTGSFGPMRFLSVVQVSVVVDVARNATVWCSILGILGNKWCAARGPVGGGATKKPSALSIFLERANLDVFFGGTILGNLQLMLLSWIY